MSLLLAPIVRLETPADHRRVEELTRLAFWNLYRPGCDEHFLVHVMRAHPDHLPELSHLAEVDGQVVGSIHYTRSWLTHEDGSRMETATFGPICVHPDFQRRGVGTSLIRHTRKMVEARGLPAIIILGDPHNYVTHGFRTGRDVGICSAEGKYPLGLLVLELRPGLIKNPPWRFHTSPVFEFNPADAEAWDAGLPAMEKKVQPSQVLFSMLVRSVVE